jgi:hypothetical protein
MSDSDDSRQVVGNQTKMSSFVDMAPTKSFWLKPQQSGEMIYINLKTGAKWHLGKLGCSTKDAPADKTLLARITGDMHLREDKYNEFKRSIRLLADDEMIKELHRQETKMRDRLIDAEHLLDSVDWKFAVSRNESTVSTKILLRNPQKPDAPVTRVLSITRGTGRRAGLEILEDGAYVTATINVTGVWYSTRNNTAGIMSSLELVAVEDIPRDPTRQPASDGLQTAVEVFGYVIDDDDDETDGDEEAASDAEMPRKRAKPAKPAAQKSRKRARSDDDDDNDDDNEADEQPRKQAKQAAAPRKGAKPVKKQKIVIQDD